MSKAEARKKRPYMASHQRRRALLDVAAEIVGRSGWSALTMKGLAAEAGVSRQLVYDHFEDGTGLVLSTIERLFQESHRATAEVLRESAGEDHDSCLVNLHQFVSLKPAVNQPRPTCATQSSSIASSS